MTVSFVGEKNLSSRRSLKGVVAARIGGNPGEIPSMAKKKPTPRDECANSFEESLAELEKIVAELESGELGLSEALAHYEDGVKHLKSCQQLLERAERKIELLSGVDADGNPITEPFEDTELESLNENSPVRSSRRAVAAKSSAVRISLPGNEVDDAGRLF
jgi:exodeoxyribonuclease VII small subunit